MFFFALAMKARRGATGVRSDQLLRSPLAARRSPTRCGSSLAAMSGARREFPADFERYMRGLSSTR